MKTKSPQSTIEDVKQARERLAAQRLDSQQASANGIRRLTILFVLTYITHGIATQFGLIAQPLQYFLKSGLRMTAAEVSSYLAVMMLPWVFKPFYGMICDFVPLLGYRRKSYLIAANLMTALAFAVMAFSSSLPLILTAFVMSAVGMSLSTAVTVGLAVEGGRDGTRARDFFALQTLCYYTAIILASLVGGFLCQTLSPEMALHVAAGVAMVPVLSVSVLTPFLYKEQKSALNVRGMNDTLASLRQVVRMRSLWMVALFIWCWDFSPSFGVPLYFFQSNNLHFSQAFIGQLAGWNAAGMVLGALLYRKFLQKRNTRQQLWIAISLGTASTLAYLLLSTPESAIALEIGRGVANVVTILGIYALAADVCPRRTEVTVMATLLAVRSLALEGSTYIGGQLFTHVFHNELAPLIIVATITTGLCAVLIPLLPRGRTT